jgi:predicted NodU family carbamoyl transferase
MKVLGYTSNSHHSGVAYIVDGEIKGCFLEERFSRIKSADTSFNHPKLSLEKIQSYFNFDVKDDDVFIATSTPVFVKSKNRLETIDNINGLTTEFLNLNKKVHVYPHHFCHALPTHFTSGFTDKTLNLVIDGSESTNVDFPCILTKENAYKKTYNFRNAHWASAYSVYNDVFKKIDSQVGAPYSFSDLDWLYAFNSLPSFWSIILPFFGFKSNKDEGKLMGLAARGEYDEKLYNFLKPCFSYKKLKFDLFAANTFFKKLTILDQSYDFKKDETFKCNLSYVFQKLTEDITLEYIIDLYEKYQGHEKLCLSGGLFANVKLNQRINELTPFNEIYIMPAMTDEGIAMGAAMVHCYEQGYKLQNKRWDNVFLGIGYSQEELDTHLDTSIHNIQNYDPKIVAKYLSDGKVVGTFQGRSEFGPRALGARSIMVEPSKKETHEYINQKLDRHEVMPFAPIVMSEYISDICYAYKSLRSAEFMTLCYTVKDEWVQKIPAVINTYDNTARPQVVYKERNPHFHEILDEFNKITGIPVLMNTSFNSHGEPIINHPSHAINHLNKGSVDYLILGDKIISKK